MRLKRASHSSIDIEDSIIYPAGKAPAAQTLLRKLKILEKSGKYCSPNCCTGKDPLLPGKGQSEKEEKTKKKPNLTGREKKQTSAKNSILILSEVS